MKIEILPPKNQIDITDKRVQLQTPCIGDTKKAYKLANSANPAGTTQKAILFDTAIYLLQEILLIDEKRLTLDQVEALSLPFLIELSTSLFPLLTEGLTPLLQSMSNMD